MQDKVVDEGRGESERERREKIDRQTEDKARLREGDKLYREKRLTIRINDNIKHNHI
jgi:hypothetical protein